MRDSAIKLGNLEQRIQIAIERFWGVREAQGQRQDSTTGKKDAGARSNVTGGKHLDAFLELMTELVRENCPDVQILTQEYARD